MQAEQKGFRQMPSQTGQERNDMQLRTAFSLLITALLIGTPFIHGASGSSTMNGFIIDDEAHLTGVASATLSLSNSTLSGTVTIVSQVFTVTASYFDTLHLHNGTNWDRYRGFANSTAGSRPFETEYNNSLQVAIGRIQKPDIASVAFTVAADPSLLSQMRSVTMANRTAYLTAATYNVFAASPSPRPGVLTSSPGFPLVASIPGSGSLTDPGTTLGGQSGMEGSYWDGVGPHSTDTAISSNGAQLTYGFLSHYRNVNFPSTFDELPLQTPEFSHVTYYAYSPDLKPANSYQYVWGTVHTSATLSDHNPDSSISPLSFFNANTYPAPGSSGPVSFSVGIQIGFGPISSGLDIDPTYNANTAAISSSGMSAEADVDWSYGMGSPTAAPLDKNSAIGMQAGIGAFDGVEGSYEVESRAIIDYSREYCLPLFAQGYCYGIPWELESAPTWGWHAIKTAQASHWNVYPCCPSVPTDTNFDLGDRAITSALTTSGTPTDRSTDYSGNPTLYVYHDFFRLCFAGPTATAASIPIWHEFYWYNPQTNNWDRFNVLQESIPTPGVNTCWVDYKTHPSMQFATTASPTGTISPKTGDYLVQTYVNRQFVDEMEFNLE